MPVYRRGDHRTQFDGSAKAGANCTPTSGANGAREATDGEYDHSGGYVRGLVAVSEETNPASPGWSLGDLDKAMSRAGVPFEPKVGAGWASLKAWRDKGCGIVLQGDSDQFSNGTCSGAFDGDHAVYIHPETRVVDGATQWLLGDPICSGWRWELESELRQYATKFNASISFGVFPTPLRKLADTGGTDVPQKTITDTMPRLVTTAVNSKWFELDGVTLVGTTHLAMVDRYSPYGVEGGMRSIYVTPGGGSKQLVLVAAVSMKPVPDSTPYDAADLANATSTGKAEGVKQGTEAEKSRLRTFLGL